MAPKHSVRGGQSRSESVDAGDDVSSPPVDGGKVSTGRGVRGLLRSGDQSLPVEQMTPPAHLQMCVERAQPESASQAACGARWVSQHH